MNKFTHYGWFSFCPVYVGGDKEAPDVMARHRWLQPLLHLAVYVQGLAIGLCSMVNPDWEPTWRIRITGAIE